MKIATRHDPIATFLGVELERYVGLTQAERATLRRAHAILEQADELQREIDDDEDGHNSWHLGAQP